MPEREKMPVIRAMRVYAMKQASAVAAGVREVKKEPRRACPRGTGAFAVYAGEGCGDQWIEQDDATSGGLGQEDQAKAIFSSFWPLMVSNACFTGRPPRRQ